MMSLVPTSVSVVSCRDANSIHGCTISSLVSVNIQEESPEILFVLKKQSLVGEKIRANNFFTINVLSVGQAEVARKYSNDRSPENI
jgi:flavin reductase (DIM6/NTAB) family NADH-FMN oxidoreductase RutF